MKEKEKNLITMHQKENKVPDKILENQIHPYAR